MTAENEGMFSCTNTCWIVGALLGIVAAMLAAGRFGSSIVVASIIGLAVLAVVAIGLLRLFCAGLAEYAEMAVSRAKVRAEERRSALVEQRRQTATRNAETEEVSGTPREASSAQVVGGEGAVSAKPEKKTDAV